MSLSAFHFRKHSNDPASVDRQSLSVFFLKLILCLLVTSSDAKTNVWLQLNVMSSFIKLHPMNDGEEEDKFAKVRWFNDINICVGCGESKNLIWKVFR